MRAPQPDVNEFPEPKHTSFRHWLSYAGKKLGLLPDPLTATKVWNPGNVAFGASAAEEVSVPGARMGDAVIVGFTDQEPGVLFTGQVSEPNVVTVVLTNASVDGIAFNMNSGTLRVTVLRVG